MSHSRHIKRNARRRRALVPSGTRKVLPQVYLRGGDKIMPEIYLTDHDTHKGTMAKWMLSTMLAGVVGVGAIGTVIYASMNSDKKLGPGSLTTQLRAIGTKALQPFKPLLVNRQTGPRFIGSKGDRLIVTSKGLSTRQIIHDTYAKKRDNRRYLIIKPYARIIATLATASPGKQAAIPPFDPYKLYASKKLINNVQKGRTAAASASTTTKIFDLPALINAADDPYTLPDTVAYQLILIAADDYFSIAKTSQDQQRDAASDLLEQTASGIMPVSNKNTTIIARTLMGEVTEPEVAEQHQKTVRSGDSINIMLRSAGAENWQSVQIIAAMNKVYPAHSIQIGQKMRYVAVPKPGDGSKTEPAEIALYSSSNRHLVTVFRNEAGTYIASKTPGKTKYYGRKRTYPRRATVYQSFYHSGLMQKLPATKIMKMLRIHAFDTDFKRRTQPGDSFEAFFDTHKDKKNFDNIPDELLFTAITTNGKKHAFYRFRTPDGRIGYYDRAGKNAKKFLMRKPVRGSRVRLSSGFGYRMHPILKRRKLHAGTDWAASIGTPILAAGNGTIVKASMTRFNGNYVKIRHANGYKTSYSHMNKIAKGIKKGARVRQGQVIGQVGNTGRSTGPHLHYEVLIKNRAVNAMTIPVPRGRVLKGYLLTKFKKERDRIDELMSRDPVTTKVAAAN